MWGSTLFFYVYIHYQSDSFDKVHKSLEVDLSVYTGDVSASLEYTLQPELGLLLGVELLQKIDYSHTIKSFCDWLKAIYVSEVMDFLSIYFAAFV